MKSFKIQTKASQNYSVQQYSYLFINLSNKSVDMYRAHKQVKNYFVLMCVTV